MKKGDIVYYLYSDLSGKFDFYIVKIEELTTKARYESARFPKSTFLRAKVIKRIASNSSVPLTLNHVYTFDKKYLFKQDTKKKLIHWIFSVM